MKSKASGPSVGRPARGSRTGRPIMVALDLLGRRGALRILWELRHGVPMTFRVLQAAAETNPALLNTRLAELRGARLIGHDGDGYVLTPIGKELLVALHPLSEWARKWGYRAATQAKGVRAKHPIPLMPSEKQPFGDQHAIGPGVRTAQRGRWPR